MIAITFALPAESAGFLRLLQLKKRGHDRVISGELYGRKVSVLHTGVGRQRAQSRFARFVQHHKAELLICTGFAGAVDDVLAVGDIFLARNFSDPAAAAAAMAALRDQGGILGDLATAPVVIDSAAERAALARRCGAAAVDMETEFLAEIAGAIGLPMLAMRVISDTAAAPFPAPPSVLFDLDRQRTSLTALLPYLLVHPGAVPRLLRFSGQVARARRSLTTALDLLLRGDLS
jgi:nucleoside phosphorylase